MSSLELIQALQNLFSSSKIAMASNPSGISRHELEKSTLRDLI
jgi:hypothetical protein